MEDKLTKTLNLAKKIFEIIKDKYLIYFNDEKKELLLNLDYDNFFKYQKEAQLPLRFIGDDGYYLNSDDLDIEIIAFMCLSIFCGQLNSLKTELIMLEAKKIVSELPLSSNTKQILELGPLVFEGLLKDVPYNIIFLDSDIEIFNYLVSEKGYKTARLYMEISSNLERKIALNNFNPFLYLKIIDEIDNTDIYEELYEFIRLKVM